MQRLFSASASDRAPASRLCFDLVRTCVVASRLPTAVAMLAAALTTLAACSSADDSQGRASSEAVSATTQKIIKGKTSADDQDAVVLLIHSDFQSYFAACTGTLIAPNLVLTARHCVSDTVEAPFGCDSKGNLVNDGAGGGKVGKDFAVDSLYVYTGNQRPDFNSRTRPVEAAKGEKILHDDAKQLCSHDLALILLDTKIEGAKIAPVRLESPPIASELMTSIGWGVTSSTPFPNTRQQRTGVKVLHVGPYSKGIDQVPPNDFEVGESICQGDSGGPALSEDTGAVIGVVSRGGNGTSSATDPAAGCVGGNAINNYTQVAPFKDLIVSAYGEAGQDPWNEGQPNPTLAKLDGDCGGPEACQSNLCVTGKCTQDCASNPCPSGFDCKDEGDQRVCRSQGNGDSGGFLGCATAPRASSSSNANGGPLQRVALLFGTAFLATAWRRSRSRSRRDRTRSS